MLTFLVTSISFGQENFISGEIVTKSGQRIEGFIDYRDWTRNPEEIIFRNSQTGPRVTYTPEDITEFSVPNQKYISRFVTMDETPFKVPQVQEVLRKNQEGTVFLKVLEEGTLSLYQFRGLRNNFYVERSGEITELISHEYVPVIRGRYIFVDEDSDKYLRQLDEVAPDCESISKRSLDYEATDLRIYAMNCNRLLSGEDLSDDPDFYQEEKGKISLRPYMAFRSGNAEYTEALGFVETSEVSFSGFQFGVDVNLFLKGDLNTRAVILGIGFSNYNVDETDIIYESFNSVNFRLGYLAILEGDKAKPYISVSVIPEFRTSPYYDEEDDESFLLGFNLEAGVQFSFLQAGLRADLGNNRAAKVKQQGFSVVLGVAF